MTPPVAQNLTDEERAIVERARKAFADPGPAPTQHQAEKMQAEADANNATHLRQQAKAQLAEQANRDGPV